PLGDCCPLRPTHFAFGASRRRGGNDGVPAALGKRQLTGFLHAVRMPVALGSPAPHHHPALADHRSCLKSGRFTVGRDPNGCARKVKTIELAMAKSGWEAVCPVPYFLAQPPPSGLIYSPGGVLAINCAPVA